MDRRILSLAKSKNVSVKTSRVIYQLIDDVKAMMLDRVETTFAPRVLGEARVQARFQLTRNRGTTAVAGCKVLKGTIQRSAKVRVIRHGEVVYDGMNPA